MVMATPSRFLWLELFRPNQRDEQVDDQQDGHCTDNDVFHDLKPPAGIGVPNGNYEKANCGSDIHHVQHRTIPFVGDWPTLL
jgi:hypothetical protein